MPGDRSRGWVAPRAEVLERLAGVVIGLSAARPALVAVDGPDASGKTSFAGQLALRVRQSRPVVRIQADWFLNPRAVRYRRGRFSAEGYLNDTYDFAALRSNVLAPLSIGDRWIVPAVFDRVSDSAVPQRRERVSDDAVVILDGSFLLSRQLRDHWRLGVLLDVPEAELLSRALTRDEDRLGGPDGVRQRYQRRYLPGFRLYLQRERPHQHADIIIDNTTFEELTVRRWDPTTNHER